MDSCKKRRTNCHRHWISMPWSWELCICQVKISPVFSRSLCLSLMCLGVCCQTKQEPKECVEFLCSSTKVMKAPVTFKSWLRGRFVAITCKRTGTGWWWQEALHWWHDKKFSQLDLHNSCHPFQHWLFYSSTLFHSSNLMCIASEMCVKFS